MGIGILLVAVGLIIKKRDKIQKVFTKYKNKLLKKGNMIEEQNII